MNISKSYMMNRMARVIRSAISDKEIMNCLTPKDLTAVLSGAVDSLTPSDVRGFIYRCMTNREVGKGLIMADRAIEFALEVTRTGDSSTCSEIIGAAVGTLTILAESLPPVQEKIDALLQHERPEIVVAVIENLGHTSSIDNFNRVSDLLLHWDSAVSLAAARYVEACTRDAAFRKRRNLHVIEDEAEEFLRRALLRLESIYHKLKDAPKEKGDVRKRIAILVAMMYNEILDSMDWKRFRAEQVDKRIYYALEGHLSDEIGPDAHPFLCKMLTLPDVESGIKRSALHTLGRLCKTESIRKTIVAWLPAFISGETSIELVKVAKSIARACRQGKSFSVLSYLPEDTDRVNIIPRAAGAPPKLKKKPRLF